jgi:hypothetical protein
MLLLMRIWIVRGWEAAATALHAEQQLLLLCNSNKERWAEQQLLMRKHLILAASASPPWPAPSVKASSGSVRSNVLQEQQQFHYVQRLNTHEAPAVADMCMDGLPHL